MGYDVVASGYVSMDHIIRIAEPVRTGFTSIVTNANNTRIFYGGCSVNITVALSRLGKKAVPLIRVGDDFESTGFKHFLESASVPLDGIHIIKGETTSTCYLLQDNQNDHITVFYPGSMDKKYAAELEDVFFKDTRLGVVTVASREDNTFFLEKCKKYQVPIVFGMKDDFDAFPTDFLKEILLESRIVFMNEVEREIVEERLKLHNVQELFSMGSVEIIVITLGKKGSICYEKKKETYAEYKMGIFEVPEVTDATGSGDAYMSGFLYGYLEHRPIEECLRYGAALSSFVLQSCGCCTNIPDITQLENKVKEKET